MPEKIETQSGNFAEKIFLPMIRVLDLSLDTTEIDMISADFAYEVVKAENELPDLLITLDAQRSFDRKIVKDIVHLMDDDQFKKLADSLKKRLDTPISKKSGNSHQAESVKQAYRNLIKTKKDRRFNDITQSGDAGAIEKIQIDSEFYTKKFAQIMTGDTMPFHDAGFVEEIPDIIDILFDRGKKKTAEALIEKMGDELSSETSEVQKTLSDILGQIAERLFAENRFDIMRKLSFKLINWIIFENSISPEYEHICLQLKKLGRVFIEKNKFEECNHILETFNIIHCGKIKKTLPVQVMAGKMLSEIATDDILKPILSEFITNKEKKRKLAAANLIQFGAASVPNLLNILKKSQDRSERNRIIRLLSDIGLPAMPAMLTEIGKDEAWYYVRNLILLIGKVGSEEHLPVLRPFLSHRSLRVQRETLNSIKKIGGPKSMKMLVSVLPFAEDRLKVDIVEILGWMRCAEAVPLILELLDSRALEASKIRDEVAEKICISLGNIGDRQSIPALTSVIEHEAQGFFGGKSFDSRVKYAAANALVKLKKNNTSATNKLEKSCLDSFPPEKKQKIKHNSLSVEENHKTMDPHYLERWSILYHNLTIGETKSLYYSLEEKRYEADEVVFNQGAVGSELFFVDEGQLVLSYDQDNEDIWIKTLKPGYIAGVDSFFNISVYTTSLIAVSNVRLTVLNKDILTSWHKEFPELEKKLQSFCSQFDNVHELLKIHGMERRGKGRHEVHGKVSVRLLNAHGKMEEKIFRGDIHDVSADGLALIVKLPDELTSKLLGRNLNMKFLLYVDADKQEIDQNGKVVAVSCKVTEQHSIHIRFDKTILPLMKAKSVEGLSGGGVSGRQKKNAKKSEQEKDDFLKTTW